MEKEAQGKQAKNKVLGVAIGIAMMVSGVPMLFHGTTAGLMFVVAGVFVLAWSLKNRSKQKANKEEVQGLMLMLCFMAATAVILAPHAAFAFVTPGTGSFGYSFYDLISNKIVAGAIGWTAAACALGFGIHELIHGKLWGTIAAFLAAGGLANLNSIVTTLGVIR
ncbi:MAG: hypothetical protein M0Z61_15310 [Nitrospiraceae bacterium]|nr:hypothetical protein [Nitrospiraceae bacterium]